LQQITVNAAGLTAIAKEPDATRALIRHLTSPEAKTIYQVKGLGALIRRRHYGSTTTPSAF
jgi:molybdate transport system substrate-binding protein